MSPGEFGSGLAVSSNRVSGLETCVAVVAGLYAESVLDREEVSADVFSCNPRIYLYSIYNLLKRAELVISTSTCTYKDIE